MYYAHTTRLRFGWALIRGALKRRDGALLNLFEWIIRMCCEKQILMKITGKKFFILYCGSVQLF